MKKGNKNLVEDACALIELSLVEAKRISNNLSPAVLNDFGLLAGLKKIVQIVSIDDNIKIHLRISDTIERLPKEIEWALFRITQEALTNAIKHSKCNQFYILFYRSNDSFILKCIDNGRGIRNDNKNNPQLRGYGLNNIFERAKLIGAAVEIKSKKDKYTSINIRFKK